MGATLIVVCSSCGGLLMAAVDQRTRTCPYCGSRVNVQKAKKIATAENAFAASQMLRDLKSKKGFNR